MFEFDLLCSRIGKIDDCIGLKIQKALFCEYLMGQWDNKTKGAWERLELTGNVVWCMEHIDAQTKCVRRKYEAHDKTEPNGIYYEKMDWLWTHEACDGLWMHEACERAWQEICVKRMSISLSLSLSMFELRIFDSEILWMFDKISSFK